ncbi:MAG: N-carbamyl-D-amino acid amidohydrolase, partial [Burkholderiaceae bacterium]|nr:N-carbamyl-D-amino acid amidohydrolase [Burkholderiaceae bacterium]
MARIITVGAAQLGPIARSQTRSQVVDRMLALMNAAKGNGCDLVVFPELALTTFFPRWFMPDQQEVDAFFEREMPGAETQRLFDAARWLG